MTSRSTLRAHARRHAWLTRHAQAVCATALAAALGCAAYARRLELRTDLAELLPADHPAVVALRDVSPRQRSASNLVLLIESTDARRSAAFAGALRPRLQSLVPGVLTAVDIGPDREPAAFAGRWRWLYAPLADLEEIERLADAVIAQRSNPAYVSLDDEDPADALRRREAEMRARLPEPPAHARFQSEDGHIVGLRVWRRRDGLGGSGDHAALAAVRAAVATTGPHAFDVTVRYTGPIAQAVEEEAGVRDDLSLATAVCTLLVLGALWLAFGRVALVGAALWPTVLGLVAALAMAARALGALNLNTAFLISIILGNGINAPIVVLADLRRAQTRWSLPKALSRATLRSLRGVSAAMLSAAAAYGVLGATRFRGFRQFGLIGGAGMLAVLIATFVALPPFLLVVHAHAPRWLRPGRDRFSPPILHVLGAIDPRRARVVAFVAGVAAIAGVVRFARAPVAWDLSKLRSRGGEAARLWPTMEALGMGSVGAGYIANTAVLRVDDATQADRVADALRAQDAAGPKLLASVRTLDSLLPRDQQEKLAVLARLRERIDDALDRHAAVLSTDEQRRLREARPPETLRAIDADDLPREVREAFTEVDGTRGRLIGIDADHRRYHDWDGHALLELARVLRVDVDGRHYVAASAATVFAGMLETLLHDAPRLSALALGVVCVLLVITLRRRSPHALAALGLGLFVTTGAAGLLGLQLNFMSFAAVPISIGVGADYTANLWSRVMDGRVPPIAATVALCSLTTVIGYSSLLLGRNGALRSFGLLSDLGELGCLGAVLLSPALFARRPPC